MMQSSLFALPPASSESGQQHSFVVGLLMSFPTSRAKEIIRLLKADSNRKATTGLRPAVVEVRQSSIPGAGKGLFATQNIGTGRFLCLYPGVYSPGLPPLCDPDAVYLGLLSTPSGLTPEENAYILNVKTHHGGYIDVLALEQENGIRLDKTNPSACGHRINHSVQSANTAVESFEWSELLLAAGVNTNDSIKHLNDHDEVELPNISRSDGAPRFALKGQGIMSFSGNEPLCGAAFYALRKIHCGEEILFDYGLYKPFPAWAAGWYE